MTWGKQKSNMRKKQFDFYADIVMEVLDEFNEYLRLIWRFTKVLILLELFSQYSYDSETHSDRFRYKKRSCVFMEQLHRHDSIHKRQNN